MTRQIGQRAFRAPSSAAVSILAELKCQMQIDSNAVITTVMMQARKPGNFRTLSAAMSQMIGTRARIKRMNCILLLLILIMIAVDRPIRAVN